MSLKILAKSLLLVYRYLERVGGAIDKLVDNIAVNSTVMHSSYLNINDAHTVANKLLELTERKIALINLKLLIEKTLLSIDKDAAKLLIKKYFQNKKSNEICEDLNFSSRTYFRKSAIALNSFMKGLTRFGYDSDKIEKMLVGQKWILDVCKKCENEEVLKEEKNSEESAIDEKFLNNICKSLKHAFN